MRNVLTAPTHKWVAMTVASCACLCLSAKAYDERDGCHEVPYCDSVVEPKPGDTCRRRLPPDANEDQILGDVLFRYEEAIVSLVHGVQIGVMPLPERFDRVVMQLVSADQSSRIGLSYEQVLMTAALIEELAVVLDPQEVRDYYNHWSHRPLPSGRIDVSHIILPDRVRSADFRARARELTGRLDNNLANVLADAIRLHQSVHPGRLQGKLEEISSHGLTE